MRRRAHVEFKGPDTIQVTTFCHQKTFSLESIKGSDKYLDLVTLKLSEEPPNFYLIVWAGQGTTEEPYELSVCAKVNGNGRANHIGNDDKRFIISECPEYTFEVTLKE